jgi:two-component system, NarL family, response regulator
MSTASLIKVLIADDHPIFRVGLRNLIDREGDMRVVGEAGDGAGVVQAIASSRPDVTLLDLRMPGSDGARIIAELLASDPDTRVIILTSYDGDDDVRRAVEAGARGYLLKDAPPEELLGAIRDVHAGGRLFSARVTAKLFGPAAGSALSASEHTVLELLARGLSNKEIQAALSMAEGTLKHHLARVFGKLEVSDRTQAVLVALKRGLVHLN